MRAAVARRSTPPASGSSRSRKSVNAVPACPSFLQRGPPRPSRRTCRPVPAAVERREAAALAACGHAAAARIVTTTRFHGGRVARPSRAARRRHGAKDGCATVPNHSLGGCLVPRPSMQDMSFILPVDRGRLLLVTSTSFSLTSSRTSMNSFTNVLRHPCATPGCPRHRSAWRDGSDHRGAGTADDLFRLLPVCAETITTSGQSGHRLLRVLHDGECARSRDHKGRVARSSAGTGTHSTEGIRPRWRSWNSRASKAGSSLTPAVKGHWLRHMAPASRRAASARRASSVSSLGWSKWVIT